MAAVRMFLGVLVTALILLGSESASSQNIPATCTPGDTVIYFGNGVFKTRTAAMITLKQFEIQARSQFSTTESNGISFVLAYNTTNGRLADLFESFIQDIASDASAFWRTLAILVPMPTSFRDKLVSFAASIEEGAFVSSQDLSIQVASYKNTILEGKKAIVVSHSQGNFFANAAYGEMSASPSFGIVAVANPASSVASGGPHTTLVEDLVILGITAAKQAAGLPTPQIPNVTNFLTLADLSGHGFIEAYLAPNSNSKSKILTDLVSVRSGLQQPTNTATQGIITATLTWGSQPDVDLHAFEPNGTHVYYANRIGPSGFLDVDDVTSFGPEHYVVRCTTLETGTYRIGVNYYSGSAPETANVLIQAGLTSRGFSVFLPSALSSAGNANPISVGTIVVTGDAQRGFSFSIQ